jgi:hypothetical protein
VSGVPGNTDTPKVTPSVKQPLTDTLLKNAEYSTEWEDDGIIKLTDGRYDGEPYVEDSATHLIITLVEPVAFGDLDGDGIDDAAVILAADPGGSGTFVSLEAVYSENGEPHHVASYALGDRARIEALTIANGRIVLEMSTHGPDDPMCCPSKKTTLELRLENEQLILVSEHAVTIGNPAVEIPTS